MQRVSIVHANSSGAAADPLVLDERLRFYEGESVLQLTCDALLAQDYDRLYSGGNDDTSTNRLDFAASEPAADVVGNAVKDLEGVKASMTNEVWHSFSAVKFGRGGVYSCVKGSGRLGQWRGVGYLFLRHFLS